MYDHHCILNAVLITVIFFLLLYIRYFVCVFFYISNAKTFPTWHVSKGFVKTHFPKVALVAAVHVNLYKGLLSVGQAPLMAWAVHAAPTQHRSVRTQTGMDVGSASPGVSMPCGVKLTL